MDIEPVARTLDKIAGGRHSADRVPEAVHTDPRTKRSFRVVGWLLVVVLVLGASAVGEAVLKTRQGVHESWIIWWRLVVIFLIATTLFYFLWRAAAGLWWAYSRLRLFSIVFPVVAIGTCLVPGLYPGWMIAEQVAFSLVLLVVWRVLSATHLREGFDRARRVPEAAS